MRLCRWVSMLAMNPRVHSWCGVDGVLCTMATPSRTEESGCCLYGSMMHAALRTVVVNIMGEGRETVVVVAL